MRESEKALPDVVVVTMRRTGTVCGTCGVSLSIPAAADMPDETFSKSSSEGIPSTAHDTSSALGETKEGTIATTNVITNRESNM